MVRPQPTTELLWVSKWMMHLWIDDFLVHPQPTAELLWVFKWMVHLWVNELWFIHNP
jgi:hypothetical protein